MNANSEALQAQVGTEVGVSRWFPVTQGDINTFADITHDPQFIHIDPERAAAESPFGGTIAHGFFSLSLLSAMALDTVPKADDVRMGVNYGLNRLRFVSPVPIGSKVRGRFTLANLDLSKPAERTITFNVTVEIDNEEKPALVAEWIVRHYLEDS